jgi:hypothetical protein
MPKECKYFLTVATLAVKNGCETIVETVVGSDRNCIWLESEVRRSVFFSIWQDSGVSRREGVFKFLFFSSKFLV